MWAFFMYDHNVEILCTKLPNYVRLEFKNYIIEEKKKIHIRKSKNIYRERPEQNSDGGHPHP